jgi:hypothetical protein
MKRIDVFIILITMLIVIIILLMKSRNMKLASLDYLEDHTESCCDEPTGPVLSCLSQPVLNSASFDINEPYDTWYWNSAGVGDIWATVNTFTSVPNVTGDISAGGVVIVYQNDHHSDLGGYVVQPGLQLTDTAEPNQLPNMNHTIEGVSGYHITPMTALPDTYCQEVDIESRGQPISHFAVSQWFSPEEVNFVADTPDVSNPTTVQVSWTSIVGADEYVVDVSMEVVMNYLSGNVPTTLTLHYGETTNATSLNVEVPPSSHYEEFIGYTVQVRGYKYCNKSERIEDCVGRIYSP